MIVLSDLAGAGGKAGQGDLIVELCPPGDTRRDRAKRKKTEVKNELA